MQTRVEQGVTTTYTPDTAHKHAVKQAGSNYFCYDANGNMTRRNATSSACTNGDAMSYDVENRLTSVTHAGVTTAMVYNGDGTRVKRTVSNAGTTYYIGNYYEVWVPNSGTTTFNKYYYFGAQRVAAKIAGTLFYFQGDHLGSSSVVMTPAGTSFYSRQTYFPYGAQRTTEGSTLPTDYTFTGQKNDDSTGLMFYGARYYDTSLGRFTQPDTIVPSPMDPQSLNRYSYVRNNPVRYVDPTGHAETCEESCGQEGTGDPSEDNNENTSENTANTESQDTPADDGGNQNPNDNVGCWPHCKDKDDVVSDSANPIVSALPVLAGVSLLPAFSPPKVGDTIFRIFGAPLTTDPEWPIPGSGPFGRSWTPNDPSLIVDYRESAGLPSFHPKTSLV